MHHPLGEVDVGLGVVSIHAPVKGATPGLPAGPARRAVSIHAPVKGATPVLVGLAAHERVSIHAPVKGATNKLKRAYVDALFQSTRP